jgi:ATP-dependent RNA helicase RhlE
VYHVSRQGKPRLLAQLLTRESVARGIVFTRTKHGADRVVRQLKKAGIRADAIHGNKTQSARQRTMANFKSSRTHVLVATDLASRGLDVEHVSHVVNFDLPHEPETYLHRIGRTGRAGATGIAISFCDHEERTRLRAIERLLRRQIRVERPDAGQTPALAPSEPIEQPIVTVRENGFDCHRKPRRWRRKVGAGGSTRLAQRAKVHSRS